jgi:hypothetical protein
MLIFTLKAMVVDLLQHVMSHAIAKRRHLRGTFGFDPRQLGLLPNEVHAVCTYS